ncbi:hypothetical protein SNE40_017508 [Patella caerulea]|uniref:Uncharacterized protein n=1 Tax=Patella caerulea TaxID=87958 RepID=A0AAN8JE72_PATCE
MDLVIILLVGFPVIQAVSTIQTDVCHPCFPGHTGTREWNFDGPADDTSVTSLMRHFVDRVNDVKEKVTTAIEQVVDNNYDGDVGYLCQLRMAGESDIPSTHSSSLSQVNPLTKTYNQVATLSLYFQILNWDFIKNCGLDFTHLIGTPPVCYWKQVLRHFRHRVPGQFCRKTFPIDGVTSCSTAVDLAYVILESSRGILATLDSQVSIYKSILENSNSENEAMQIILDSRIM